MKRKKSGAYLNWIRDRPCVVCGDNTSVEAAHIRFADLRAAKRPTGMGERPDDSWAIPLCGDHHRLQHSGNERKFWKSEGIDPIFVALALNRVAGNCELGDIIVANARR